MKAAWAGGGLLITTVSLLAGCSNGASSSSPAAQGGAAPGQMSLKRVIHRPEVSNELNQLGLYYQLYSTDNHRSPKSLADLKPSIERDMPKLYKAIEDGYYVVVWGIPTLSSNVVVAHEKDPDENGMRQVLLGDGSVRRMNNEELQTALKAK
jgi:hypothetical protein